LMDGARVATPPSERFEYRLTALEPPTSVSGDLSGPSSCHLPPPIAAPDQLAPVQRPRARSASPAPGGAIGEDYLHLEEERARSRSPVPPPGVVDSPSTESRSSGKEKKKKKKKRRQSSDAAASEVAGESSRPMPRVELGVFTSEEMDGASPRPPCRYGEECYRKNPMHRKQFCHPGDWDHPDTQKSGAASSSTPAPVLRDEGDIPELSHLRAPDPEPRPGGLSHGGGTGELSVRSFSVPLAGDAGGTEGDAAGADEAMPDPVEVREEVFRASSGLRSPERPPQRTDQSADLEDGEHGEHSARLPLRDDFDGAGGTDAIAEEEEEEVAESRPDPVGPAHRDRADASQGHEDDDVDDDELADPQASYVFPEQKSTFKPILKRCVFRALPASLITGLVLFVFIMLLHIINLREDEQLVVPTLYGEWIRNGPGTLVFWPHQRHEGWEIRKVPRIATLEFAVLKNRRSQELRHVLGPGLVWRREMEDMDAVRQKFQLQKTQYHRLVDSLTGEERVVRGPLVYAPEPLEHLVNGTEEALMINAQESVLVENRSSGILRVVEERGLFYPKPYEFVLGWRYPILVEEQLYAVVKNELNGSTFVQEGPVLLMLGAYEQLLKMKAKVVVRKDEYLRLVDRRTGVERVVHGPAAVAPALEEDMPSGVGKAALLTPNTAAIVLDHSTGQQHLRTVEGLLMPAAYEEILEIRSKIRVLAHQALFTRAPTGVMTLHTAGSFFLQPYDDIFSMQWSVYDGNTSEPAPKEEVTVVDLRTNRLPWKYIASTKDNVRLQLEGATLWGVVDPMTMAQSCEDAPGDILQRSRAALLSALGRVQLREFTSRVAEVTNETAEALKTDAFVVQRGLEVSGISVTRIEPVDTEVAEALQTMIKAVTQHVADMQSTETADVVSMTALQGNLRIEQIRSDLIRARAQNDMLLAVGEGQAQGKRMAAEAQTFLDGLEDSVNASSSRLDLYRSYHEELAVNNLTKLFADGPSKLYLHSNDTEIILHKAVRRNRRLSTLASGTSAEPPEPRAAPPPSKACTVEAGTADSSDKAPTCAAP